MSYLTFEMERLKAFIRLTPEERKKEARRLMYEELRAVETERRERVALEAMEKLKREREERKKVEESLKRQKEQYEEERRMQEAKQREEERRATAQKALLKAKQDQLKKEKLRWQNEMMAEEEPGKKPRYTISALKEEQKREQKEAELCHLSQVGGQASSNPPTCNLKTQQGKKKTLYNNWVGEEKTNRKPVKEKPHPKDSTYHLFAAQPGPKPKAAKASMQQQQQWTDKLKTGYWLDKYRNHRERLDEKRNLKAEEQHARYSAYKDSRSVQFYQQQDCYMGGFTQKRNGILKSMF